MAVGTRCARGLYVQHQLETTVIKIKAYDGNQWRIERIQKAIRVFGQIYGITQPQVERLIVEAQDNWGTLHIYWHEDCFPPSEEQKMAFGKAWSLCGERPKDVDHFADSIV